MLQNKEIEEDNNTIVGIPLEIINSVEFKRFLSAINNPITKKVYLQGMSLYIRSIVAKTITDLFDGNNIDIEDKIVGFIAKQKQNNLSPISIRTRISAVELFYEMNRMPLSWKLIKKAIPSKMSKKVKDRGWSREEIQRMLPVAKLRDQAIILLLSSTGMRKGALPYLKLKHLIPKEIGEIKFYEIIVYDGEPEEYRTFCTNEARLKLEEYFEFRERYKEKITPDSPVFRLEWNVSSSSTTTKPQPITPRTIDETLKDVVISSGLRVIKSVSSKNEAGKIRHDQKLVHGFRKYFETTLLDAGFDERWVDLLEGHKLKGLRENYYRPKDDSILIGTQTSDGKKRLPGYLEVMNELIIDDEYRLKKEVNVLKDKLKDVPKLETIQQSLVLKQVEIDALKQQLAEKEAESKYVVANLQEIMEKVNRIEAHVDEVNAQIDNLPIRTIDKK